jgi:DNA polymerase-3 subunit epsilon
MSSRPLTQYIAFDLETTGLLAGSDRVVEIGAVRFDRDGSVLGRFESLVNPGRPMSPSAEAVHGISDVLLANAPTIRKVLPEFFAFLGEPNSTTLLAHNASFDAGFLGAESARIGQDPPGLGVVDTLALSRRKRPDLRNHRLDVLAEAYGLGDDGRHRALSDAERVKGLWLALGGPDQPAEGLTSYRVADVRRKVAPPVGWEAIADAITLGLRVRMVYSGGSRGRGPREVTPRAFAHRGGAPYLVALCHVDGFEKSFRLDRVDQFEVVPEVHRTPLQS